MWSIKLANREMVTSMHHPCHATQYSSAQKAATKAMSTMEHINVDGNGRGKIH